jgi:transcription initiation factor IIF auxiliary subunit
MELGMAASQFAHHSARKGLMRLTVAQDQTYLDNDRWKWSVWIEGADQELDQIKEVTYRLHSSFRNPLRTIRDRDTKFKLKSEGWGVFQIPVKVVLHNGEVLKLQHDLELFYPDRTPNTE